MSSAARIARLERAVAQMAYLHHGPFGLPTLQRQAPDVAELMADWLAGTQPVDDRTFAGRETTENPPPSGTERRTP